MARTERETFAVTTIGAGSPDYAQPVTAIPVERALVVKFPEQEIAGQRYDDFATINFTATQTSYSVGTNANVAKSGNWPAGAVAKKVSLMATRPCWVRFNDPDAVPQYIPATLNPLPFTKRITTIYVYQDDSLGTLYAWIEG